MPAPGARFGRYRLLAPRGAGGMAEVYLAAVDGPEGFSRTVIVKRIRREHAADAQFVQLLAAEARLMARLKHPGIVQVFELDQADGEVFLVMEHVDGWDLGEVFTACRRRGQPLPAPLACLVGAELADALAYAHGFGDEHGKPLGIVHRDVSPSNVMLTRDGRVKLLDFGVAKLTGAAGDERTRTGLLKGKLAYMSPEQADGQPVDGRSDLFALGIVLHECLTGRRLFKGESDLETLRLVREARVDPPGASAEIDAIVLRLLARAPADRYADAAAARAALAAHAGGHASMAACLSSLGLAQPGAGAAEPATRLPATVPMALPPRPAWIAWGLAALITAAAIAPFFV